MHRGRLLLMPNALYSKQLGSSIPVRSYLCVIVLLSFSLKVTDSFGRCSLTSVQKVRNFHRRSAQSNSRAMNYQESSKAEHSSDASPPSLMQCTTASKVDKEEDLLPCGLIAPSMIRTCSATTVSTQPPQEDDLDDAAWSMYSNAYFLSGGLFYLLATSWDYSLFHSSRDASIDELLTLPQRLLYELLWFLGPFTYLLNSFIDVRWALKVRKRDRRRRDLEKLLVGKKRPKTKQNCLDEVEGGMELIPYEHDMTTGSESNDNSFSIRIEQSTTPRRKHRLRKIFSPTKKVFHRMRKHMGHRRELAAAVTFGMAAFLSVMGAACYLISTQGNFSFVIHSSREGISEIDADDLAKWAGGLESASIHMYLVSAIFALWRNPCKKSSGDSDVVSTDMGSIHYGASMSWIQTRIIIPVSRPFNDVESMETAGDIFFALASVVDVILEDSTLDDNVLWWPIVSAFLWTLDALFYLRGDFVTLVLRNEVLTSAEEENDEGQLNSVFVKLDPGSFDEAETEVNEDFVLS